MTADISEISEIFGFAESMSEICSKSELSALLGAKILEYSQYDMQVISAHVRREIDILPEPYRSRLRPYSDKWFFGRYHELARIYRMRDFPIGDITDHETYLKFCGILKERCRNAADDIDPVREARYRENAEKYELFYYIISAFAMFVLDEPGHPVGTPFPGGMAVTKKGNEFLCPIRDKEESIPHSICNYCPAKQDPKYL